MRLKKIKFRLEPGFELVTFGTEVCFSTFELLWPVFELRPGGFSPLLSTVGVREVVVQLDEERTRLQLCRLHCKVGCLWKQSCRFESRLR